MIIRTTSHRSREKLAGVLGRHPQYYFTMKDGGRFVILHEPEEIKKALAIKGVSKCRCQDEKQYKVCWDWGHPGLTGDK